MKHYLILNHTTGEKYKPTFDNISDARQWVINHCDLSDDIQIRDFNPANVIKLKTSDYIPALAYPAAYFNNREGV